MRNIEVPKISLAEAVLFAMDSAAIDEAARQLELNQRSGNIRRVEDWKQALLKLHSASVSNYSTAA